MKRLFSIFLMLVLVVTLTSTTLAMGKVPSSKTSSIKSYLVGFHVKVDKEVINAHGGKVTKQYKHIPVVAVDLPEKEIEQLVKNPKVDYIEENAKVSIDSQVVPWGISHIQTTDSQQLGYSGKGIKVGVIDTGIDYNHEDLHVSGGTSVIAGTADYQHELRWIDFLKSIKGSGR